MLQQGKCFIVLIPIKIRISLFLDILCTQGPLKIYMFGGGVRYVYTLVYFLVIQEITKLVLLFFLIHF